MPTMLQTIRRFWFAVTGTPAERAAAADPAVLHDPAAERPHDLDDPYFDPKVQRRVGDVIAKSVEDKR
jgi:hypothetical protein